MSYSVYSEFDIEQHKKTFPHYLEVIIDKDGKIMYAVPSHQEMAIALCQQQLCLTRQEVCDLTPEEYYFDWMNWLLMQTNSMAVWEGFVLCDFAHVTAKTIESLRLLKEHGLYLGEIPKASNDK